MNTNEHKNKVTLAPSSFLIGFSLFLFCLNNVFGGASCDTLIISGDVWQYFNDDTPLQFEDRNNYSNATSWLNVNTPTGFGQGDEVTVIEKENQQGDVKIQFLFKKTVNIQKQDSRVYLVELNRDDGAIVYINGVEVIRSNVPLKNVTSRTLAIGLISGDQEYKYHKYLIDPKNFNPGNNDISVIVFQGGKNSSDIRFDFRLFGYNDFSIVNEFAEALAKDREIIEDNEILLDLKAKLEKSTQELELKKANLDNNRFGDIGFFILIAISSILVGLATFLWKRNQKLKESCNQLEAESNWKSKEIVDLSMSSVKVKEFIQGLDLEIGRLSKQADSETKASLQMLVNKIKLHKQSEKEWNTLTQHFDAIHSGFFSRLKEKYSELTLAEVRHCAYIRMYLFTSEIAQLLNISEKSVQAGRYRIKKKMNLPASEDLKEVLMKF